MLNLLAIVLVIIGTFIGAYASLCLKKGAKDFSFNIIQQLRNKQLVIGIILFVLGTLAYIYALSMERLSMLYPITSLTYIWVAILSVKSLGEKMNFFKWSGIVLILLGIFFITVFAG